MGTSWVAVSINNIETRASREMTSRKQIKIFDFNGVSVAKHWHVVGRGNFVISDCLVLHDLRETVIYVDVWCEVNRIRGGLEGGGVTLLNILCNVILVLVTLVLKEFLF